MADSGQSLDETSWRDPLFAAQHGIHENTVLHYFASSPFFDPTSNNGFIVNQATFNQNMAHLIATRSAMEGRLKTMSGLEFMIAQEPAEMAPGTGTGVWIIRKQTRRKRPPEEDEITVHATYYVVGENIYMGSTIGDILGNRMLSILTSLQALTSNMIRAPRSDPWLNADYEAPDPNADPDESNLTNTRERTPSKEPSPLPEFPSFTTATSSNTNAPSPASLSKKVPISNSKIASTAESESSSFLLDETLSIALKYGDEYMDEVPIVGGPGDFHLSTTKGGKARGLDKGVAMIDWEALMKEQDRERSSQLSKTGDIPSPGKKGSKSPKGFGGSFVGGSLPKNKRRKSRMSGVGSPRSPQSPRPSIP